MEFKDYLAFIVLCIALYYKTPYICIVIDRSLLVTIG